MLLLEKIMGCRFLKGKVKERSALLKSQFGR